MSALVERIIAARDRLRPLRMQGEESIRNPAVEATEALADAANAITERDQTIHALRTRLAHAEAFSTVELQQWIYGEQLAAHEPGDSHRYAFDPESLRALLEEAGFVIAERPDAGLAVRYRAVKPA